MNAPKRATLFKLDGFLPHIPNIRGLPVSDDELPREADVAQVNWKLNESLKACRAMVDNYRLMLGTVANDNEAVTGSGNDLSGDAPEAEEA